MSRSSFVHSWQKQAPLYRTAGPGLTKAFWCTVDLERLLACLFLAFVSFYILARAGLPGALQEAQARNQARSLPRSVANQEDPPHSSSMVQRGLLLIASTKGILDIKGQTGHVSSEVGARKLGG